MNSKWEWVDDRYGAMGWFSDADKRRFENTKEFSAGKWRRLDPKEVAEFRAYIGRLAYEQS